MVVGRSVVWRRRWESFWDASSDRRRWCWRQWERVVVVVVVRRGVVLGGKC